MSTFRKTLCVDFDGVLHRYSSGWQGVAAIDDGPVPGAMRWLVYAAKRYDVCIYSSRSANPLGVRAMYVAIEKWAREQGLDNDKVRELMESLSFVSQKPAAWLTIDDRCFLFEGEFPTDEQIENFQPWYKRG